MCPSHKAIAPTTGSQLTSVSPTVTVLIATAAQSARVQALKRAIASALDQVPKTHVMVIVNGTSYDRALFAELETDTRIELHYSKVGSYPAAQRLGRSLVRTPYFCFLDDDDMFLSGSIAARLSRAQQDDAPDVVVSNGFRLKPEGDVPNYDPPLPDPDSDLLHSLLQRNWFASCAPLFRSDRVDLSFFDGESKYFEWTLLAYRLLLAKRSFAFVPHFCFRLTDSSVSLSKDEASRFAEPTFLICMIQMNPPKHVRRILLRRLANAHHGCSVTAAKRGEQAAAWRHHLRSLAYPGGLRYVSYTRHLIAAAFASSRTTA